MIKVVSVEQIRKIEVAADAAGVGYAEMMENAGSAVARRVLEVIAELPDPTEARITLLIGPGNNGGDGLVAGRVIAENSGALVRFYLLSRRDETDPHFKAVQERGLFVANAEDDQRYRVLTNMIASAHVVVDALFGIGLELPLRDPAAKLLRAVHKALDVDESVVDTRPVILSQPAAGRTARPYILAVDCPSGLDCDSGAIDNNTLDADETVTMIAVKPGLLTFPGAAAVGKLTIASAGVPATTEGLKDATAAIADPAGVRDLLPPRPANSHKGTYGKALIVGGSVNFTGAPGLSARAAYRSGAGLVSVGAPEPTIRALASQITEATWLLLPHDMGVLADSAAPLIRKEAATYSALLLGPGWGREDTTRDLLAKLLDPDAARVAAHHPIGFTANASPAEDQPEAATLPPLVIDADGLFLLAQLEEWWTRLPAGTILTPHPGEMATLAGMDVEGIQAQRREIAGARAAEWNVILVLKGAHTLIAAPDGRITTLPFKTSALATAGTGDVLAGLIVGLRAQGLAPFDAAVAAGYLHGLAGELAAQRIGSERSVIAGDVVDAIGAAFSQLA